jgi:hypothetical protein
MYLSDDSAFGLDLVQMLHRLDVVLASPKHVVDASDY